MSTRCRGYRPPRCRSQRDKCSGAEIHERPAGGDEAHAEITDRVIVTLEMNGGEHERPAADQQTRPAVTDGFVQHIADHVREQGDRDDGERIVPLPLRVHWARART